MYGFSTVTMAYICWLLSHERRVQHKYLNKLAPAQNACCLLGMPKKVRFHAPNLECSPGGGLAQNLGPVLHLGSGPGFGVITGHLECDLFPTPIRRPLFACECCLTFPHSTLIEHAITGEAPTSNSRASMEWSFIGSVAVFLRLLGASHSFWRETWRVVKPGCLSWLWAV